MNHFRLTLAVLFSCAALIANAVQSQAQDEEKDSKKTALQSSTLAELKFRCIGPAITSGRIADIAIHPKNKSVWYVAVASGGVWKTANNGITWDPVFESQGSYSIGCVAIDPNNPHIVWVGSGENNSQRSVSYGDGVYKSLDGGKSWENVGLKTSEHIGKIVVDPRNSDVVYVAAQGPLWGPGGERGLYKTTDGGKTWNPILAVSENTGVSDIVFDPRNPEVLYATSYQRRRHVWTLINGGPESKLFKSTNAGATWDTLKSGIPGGDLGRIGLAISPVNPDILYALIEAQDDKGGVYRSTDRGATWEKRNGYTVVSPQYYQEVFCDPVDPGRIVIVDTWTKISDDGGKTFRNLGNKYRHVDDHALWIDPDNTQHLIIGGDGGLYVTYDGGTHWDFIENLPVTQFYRVSVDNSEPFFYVYGGTQDNASLGAPSRTLKSDGIGNEDWLFTNGGDGFESQIDPTEPNIVYAQAQYGYLVRYDKKSGERTGIQPQPGKGEAPYRWNWDSPLLISPHKHTRLYFCANKVFRSEGRGDTWQAISPDLTRQLDRNALPVMGKIQSVDAISKNASTSFYGNIVSFDESPLREGWLYVGTDDGLIQISEDGGGAWRNIESIAGVPERTYVSCLTASMHKEGVLYATFDNHKMADFKPYVLKSSDNGKSWQPIAKGLPENGPVYSIKEDYQNPDLLFLGTEFGVYFSNDGGASWIKLTGGLPTIAVKDIAIQRRDNALVLGTFGRGFYVLDDYSPLRNLGKETLEKDAHLFDIVPALLYVEKDDQGRQEQGSTYYAAANPPFGATFTYYIKEGYTSLKEQRRKKEAELLKKKETPPYPSYEQLRAEDTEEEPSLIFTIHDADGEALRTLTAPVKKGVQRITWDLRYPSLNPVTAKTDKPGSGFLAMPGKYTVELSKYSGGKVTQLAAPVAFAVKPLNNAVLPAQDKIAADAFVRKMHRLQRALYGAARLANDTRARLDIIKTALDAAHDASPVLKERRKQLADRLAALLLQVNGNWTLESRNENTPPTITGRIQLISWQLYGSTSAPTATQQEGYRIASGEFTAFLAALKTLVETDIPQLERDMESAGAPWTPGRIPQWEIEN